MRGRPLQVRHTPCGAFASVPRIGGFSTSDVAAISALEPDLVLCYSDVQADLARQLTAAGLELHVFNHTTLAGMLAMVRRLAALTGVPRRGEQLAAELEATIDAARRARAPKPVDRPRVYFEEWDEPMICGITWVSELIELAGGEDVFAELARNPRASERVLKPADVVTKNPEVILASWCGKPLKRERLASRPGFENLHAVRTGRIFEVEGAAILAPGPGLITEGLPLLRQLLQLADGEADNS